MRELTLAIVVVLMLSSAALLGTILGLGPVLAAAALVYAWGSWFSRRQLAA